MSDEIATLPGVYCRLVSLIAERAHKLGYAIGIHGSLNRDLDLMAMPWVEDAKSAEELVQSIAECVGGYIIADGTPAGRWDEAEQKFVPAVIDNPSKKPHGRLAWNIHLGGGPFIDLSVMPRLAK